MHKLPMARVRTVFEACDAEDVVTFIASGNVVFNHAERTASRLGARLEHALREESGFDVPVMLRTAAQLQRVLADNPFADVPTKQVHVSFLDKKPTAATSGCAPEAFEVVGREAYLFLPNGMGNAKLPPKLKALGAVGTARTYQTVSKLVDLARD